MKNQNTAPASNTAVSTFNFRGFDLRCVLIDDQPWFTAKDVVEAIGLTNITMALSNFTNSDVRDFRFPGKVGGRANKLISESGLYTLIMRAQQSRPEAKAFQDWVTRDVLPAIRKDGGYIMGEEKVATGEMDEDELVLKAMEVMKRKIDRLAAERDAMHTELYFVSIAEYAALNHTYFSKQQKARLTTRARNITLERGEEIAKSHRHVTSGGPAHPLRGTQNET